MTIQEITFTPERWREFWENYKGEPQQVAAIEELRQHIAESNPCLVTEGASWVANFHKEQPKPATASNTWEGVKAAAQACGAKWPELVAAQWALESAHGQSFSGRNNAFGIKGTGSSHVTQEEVDGKMVTITAGFIDFNSLEDCINYLVTRWYKDYKGYRGVNNAPSAQEAAYQLKAQGYATDSQYPEKLIRLMASNG